MQQINEKKQRKISVKKWKCGKKNGSTNLSLNLNTNHWSDTIQWQTQQIFGKMFTIRFWDVCVSETMRFFFYQSHSTWFRPKTFLWNAVIWKIKWKKTTRQQQTPINEQRAKNNPFRIHKKCELISHKCVSWHSLIYHSHSMNLGAPFFSATCVHSTHVFFFHSTRFFLFFLFFRVQYAECKTNIYLVSEKEIVSFCKKTKNKSAKPCFYEELYAISSDIRTVHHSG